MQLKKILHISTDNKFIKQALTSFENVYPNQNSVWMMSKIYDGNISENKRDLDFTFVDIFKPSFFNELKEFDLVVLHSFDFIKIPLVVLAPKNVKFAWLGWGFDYYDYIYQKDDDMLLKKTLSIKKEINSTPKKTVLKKIFKSITLKMLKEIVKPLSLKRIASFSPVLKEDYDLIIKAKIIDFLPKFISWNYGSLEEDLIKDFIGHRVSGESILLGNSASLTNNHVEAIDLLSGYRLSCDVSIIIPLSYGDESYKNKIIEIGNAVLGERIQPVVDFMPIGEYVKLIKKCGYVIMNHKRQQAVSNIVIMLYLGARVFLREENPTYIMLKREGAVLNTVQELELNPKLIKTPLTEKEIQGNIKILYKHWSIEAIDTKTKNLVEFHLSNAS